MRRSLVSICILLLGCTGVTVSAQASNAATKVIATGPTIASAYMSACAISTTGSVSCWGASGRDYNFGQTDVPSDLGRATQITAGMWHVCALSEDGSVHCWGAATYGALDVPNDLGNVVQLSAGGWHTCALSDTGIVKCWGSNDYGETDVPSNLARVIQISAGNGFTCAITEDDAATCWGDNSKNQSNIPNDLGKAKQISAGYGYTCALNEVSKVRCWGKDSGKGETNVPTDLENVVQIAVSAMHTCAVTSNGRATCWGFNYYGQSSIEAPPGRLISQIVLGQAHTCVVYDQGTTDCRGEGYSGITNLPSNMPRTLSGGVQKPFISSTPTISGEAKIGKTIISVTSGWDSGVTYSYQWLRESIPINGANSSSYALTYPDLNAHISVQVIGRKAGYLSVAKSSSWVQIQVGTLTKFSTPKILGLAKVNQTLSALPGVWDSDVTLNYQWLRNGISISKATSTKYKLTAADKGKKISIKVTGKKLGYQTVIKTSTPLTIK